MNDDNPHIPLQNTGIPIIVGWWAFLIGIASFVFAIDRVSKLWVVRNLEMFESIQLIPALYPLFQVTRSFNTGAAFGFLANAPYTDWLFLGIALAVVGVLLWMYPRIEPGRPMARLAFGMVIGGALGNAVDRMLYSHVVDFFHLQAFGFNNVSNFADHAIVFGVILLLISNWRYEDQQRTQFSTDG